MGVIQELFTICIILSSVYVSDALSPYLDGSSLPRNYKKYQRINVESNGQSDCFCFDRPQTYRSVPDLIDPNRNGLKRIVVYLYQNTVTNEISMYTPNVQKQQHIPDLALDVGDELETIPNDKIISAILYKNPNVITLAQSDGDIENCSDEVNEPARFGEKNKRCKKHKLITSPNDVKHTSSREDEWKQSSEEPIIQHIIPHKTIHSPCVNHPHHVNDMKETESQEISQLISEENIAESASVDNINLDLQHLTDTNKSQKKRPINDQLSQILAEVGIYNYTSSSNVYGSFNKWFVNQMHRADISGPMKSNFIDVLELKRLIEDILTEHNMIVSPDGVLTDSKGKALDTGNLKLRPILIGDLLEYENLIKDNSDNNKLRLPADLPYLEALLISSVNPPKVIGIIPLGKTYIPRDFPDPTSTFPADKLLDKTGSIQKESYVPESYKNKKTEDKIEPLKSRRNLYGQLTGRLREFFDRAKEMNSRTKQQRKKTNKNIGSSKRRQQNFMKGHPSDSVESTENIDKVAIANLLKGSGHLSDRKLGKLLDKLSNIIHEESKEVEPGPSSEEGFGIDPRRVGDGPGFRIIGGLPATSSGAPISNRGRSGYIAYPLSGGYGYGGPSGYGGYGGQDGRSGYGGQGGHGGYGGYGVYGRNSLYGNKYGYG